MAIRFQCGGCSQPIEVDDEWASKNVACPYCHKTIMAPSESTLGDLSRIPTASPLSIPGGAEAGMGTPGAPFPAVAPFPAISPLIYHPNTLALVAFALACVVLLSLFAVGGLASSHELEIQSFQERVWELQREGKGLLAATQQATAELYGEHGGMPPRWMMVSGLIELGAGLAWIATLVCGIIAVRRPRRRGWAVASLVVVAIAPLLICLGVVLGGMA